MNTKIIATIAVLAILFTTCATTGSGNSLSLMDAIEQTGEKIAGELPKGSRVAIVAFESVNDNLSDYIMEELTGELFDRGIEVADRQNLEYVYKELNLQMSGDVSDESAKSIGKFLAADMVITGQLLDLDGMYRYRTSAINVETAVRASVTRLNVRSDNETRRMITALANQQTTVKVAKYGVSENSTPQTAGTFLDRGILFARRGDNEMAIADFDEAIRLNPNMVPAYLWRGCILAISASNAVGVEASVRVAMLDRAIVDYYFAIVLDPSLESEAAMRFLIVGAYVQRAEIYVNEGDYDRAIATFTNAISIDPNDAKPYFGRGVVYGQKGDRDRAIADFTSAIRLDPNNNAKTYFGRGMMYAQKGDLDRAIADWEAALRIDPNDAVIRRNLERARQERGR